MVWRAHAARNTSVGVRMRRLRLRHDAGSYR